MAQKYAATKEYKEGSANSARQNHSKEKIARTPAVVQRAQEFILEDSGTSLRNWHTFCKWMKPPCVRSLKRIWNTRLIYSRYDRRCLRLPRLRKLAKLVSNNLNMFCSKEFWPPNSPDLNPLDYYVWSVIGRVYNKSKHLNVASFQTAIEAAFANLNKEQLKRACSRFR